MLTERQNSFALTLVQFGLPFLLVAYLGLEAGGYDILVRSQVGIIAWWLAILGIVAGLLPATKVTTAGWIGIGLLLALALLTGIGALTWTESEERSMIEFSRVLSLLGVFVLMVLVQGRDGVERTVTGVAAGVVLVGLVALASRYQPDWFTIPQLPVGYSTARLSYPLEYWNGLAALMALGLGPLAWAAGAGRSVLTKSLAAASIPVILAVCFLTASRGGLIAAVAALLVLLVLVPARIKILIGLIIPAIGTLILFNMLNDRPELRDGNGGPIAAAQGGDMLGITLAVVLFVAASQALIFWLLERDGGFLPDVDRQVTRAVGAVAGIVTVSILVIAIGSGFVGDRWSEFKQPQSGDSTVSRLGNLNSGARYEFWKSAYKASESESLTGIGPGTFEYRWARSGEGTEHVRDAPSLYLEFLAETGPIGFLLILLIIFGPIGFASVLSLREGSPNRRAPIAAAAAGMTAFAVTAGIDWAWEMTVLPVVFLALVAASIGPAAGSRSARTDSRFTGNSWQWIPRSCFALFSLVAIAIIAIPYTGEKRVRNSQEHYRKGDSRAALESVQDALNIQPYSATASVQKAQLLSELGRFPAAVSAAQKATLDEPFNWKNWYVLGEVFEASGKNKKAGLARRRAQELNPNSDIPLYRGTLAKNGA